MLAFTRPVSRSLGRCELTHLPRQRIDVARARRQHAAYERALTRLGCNIVRIPGDHRLPDAVFIEDTAIVLDELAIITRPGAVVRRRETAAVAGALARHLPVKRIKPPATLDGGDVLRIGKTLYVGRTARTNAAAVVQLRRLLGPFGYRIVPVPVRGCLHLKSAVTQVADNLLLLNPAWVSPKRFKGFKALAVHPGEPYAANALRVGQSLIYPAHFPATKARLKKAGLKVVPVPCDELAKAEGAVTCCSILVNVRPKIDGPAAARSKPLSR